MTEVYRDINIRVGLALYQSNIIGQVQEINTENEASRFLVTFPDAYVDYSKLIDVMYTGTDGVNVTATYGLTYSATLLKYYFIVPRLLTMGPNLYIQFRAKYPTTNQEIVDPTIFTIKLKTALKTTDLGVVDEIPDSYTTVLQAMIDAIPTFTFGVFTSRPTTAVTGTLYYSTDTLNLAFYTGTAWSTIA